MLAETLTDASILGELLILLVGLLELVLVFPGVLVAVTDIDVVMDSETDGVEIGDEVTLLLLLTVEDAVILELILEVGSILFEEDEVILELLEIEEVKVGE